MYGVGLIFFFQAEDGIRDLVRSRGLGDVYKRQHQPSENFFQSLGNLFFRLSSSSFQSKSIGGYGLELSLIHI